MRIAYFDCFAGISGDMTLGALVDAGADFEELRSQLELLGITGYNLTAEKVVKRGISATSVTVSLHSHTHHHEHSDHHHGRGFSEIRGIIEASRLPDRVKERSIAIFRKLGEAEAAVHGTDIEEIHFHEVGAVDAIVDIVGACICLDLLEIEAVTVSPMPTFTGTVEIAHGLFPLPAPATVEILKGVPWRKLGIEGELVTPTGAAIAAGIADSFGDAPAMTIEATGYGAGTMDFGIPNVLRVMIGSADAGSAGNECEEVAVVETNIDDATPQVYEVAMDRLFEAGALDVYLCPVQMKKNRPAVMLSVVCEPGAVEAMSDIIFEETSTIGVRIDTRWRICLPRESVEVATEFGAVRVKVAKRAGRVMNVQPEYDDCRAVAQEHNVTLKRVRDAALVGFYALHKGLD